MVRNDQKSTDLLVGAHVEDVRVFVDDCQVLTHLSDAISHVGVHVREGVRRLALLVLEETLVCWNAVLVSDTVSEEADDVVKHDWRSHKLRLVDNLVRGTPVISLNGKVFEAALFSVEFEVALSADLHFAPMLDFFDRAHHGTLGSTLILGNSCRVTFDHCLLDIDLDKVNLLFRVYRTEIRVDELFNFLVQLLHLLRLLLQNWLFPLKNNRWSGGDLFELFN